MNLEIGAMSVRSIFKDDEENLENADNRKYHASRNWCIAGHKIIKSFKSYKKKQSIMNLNKRLVLTLGGRELV